MILKTLAVSMKKRSPLLPARTHVDESGDVRFELGSWFGVLAHAGTPADIVNRLNGAIVKIIGTADFRERMSGQGIDPTSSTPAEFSAYIKSELVKFSKMVQTAHIRPG